MSLVNCLNEYSQPGWHAGFLAILPELKMRASHAFRQLDPESREDSTENAILHCLLSYVRLYDRGRAALVRPSCLAWYAVLQVKAGRQAGCRLKSTEPLCRYARRRNGVQVDSLASYDRWQKNWIDQLVEDKRSSVADQVAARLDIHAWFGTLSRRTRNIATDLAQGFSTSEVARKNRVSAGRIAQMRKELKASWTRFQGDDGLAGACQPTSSFE